MKRPKQKCPGCESEQSFPLRQRPADVGNDPNKQGRVIEVYISCTTCPWERVIRMSTHEAEKIRTQIAHARGQAAWQARRHGQEFAGTMNRIYSLERELAEETAGVDR